MKHDRSRDRGGRHTGVDRRAGIGLVLNSPIRLILLDLTGGRTMAVAIFSGGPPQPSELEVQVREAMPVIESFEFHPPVP